MDLCLYRVPRSKGLNGLVSLSEDVKVLFLCSREVNICCFLWRPSKSITCIKNRAHISPLFTSTVHQIIMQRTWKMHLCFSTAACVCSCVYWCCCNKGILHHYNISCFSTCLLQSAYAEWVKTCVQVYLRALILETLRCFGTQGES